MPLYEAIAPAAIVVAVFVLLSQISSPKSSWTRWAIFFLR